MKAKFVIQQLNPKARLFFCKESTNNRISWWACRGTIEKCMNVKACATNNDGCLSSANNLVAGMHCLFVEVFYVKGLTEGANVNEVMRDSGPLLRGSLRRADIHAAIDLHRIRRDNLPADFIS